MMGDKKFSNLMRASISKQQMRGFVARQLVETSQVVKFVRMLLEEAYPNTSVRSIRASLSHQLREAESYAKCRIANDYHHAHDALLASELGRFIEVRYGDMFDNPIGIEHAMRDYIRALNDERKKTGLMPRSASMIVGSFRRNYIDRDTGEVLWDGNAETERIRRYLNYKDCYISRMTEITSGAFWNQNAISPKKGKPPVLALKGNLDPSKYGGYTTGVPAFFFVIRVRKKNKEELWFSNVLISEIERIKNEDCHDVTEFMQKSADKSGCDFITVERALIPKFQLIELDGDRFYITGKKDMRNARQLAFNQKETEMLAIIEAGVKQDSSLDDIQRMRELGDDQLVLLYDAIISKCDRFARRLSKLMRLKELRDGFIAADIRDKAHAIQSILLCTFDMTNNVANLAAIGGVKSAGRMQPTYNKELNVGNGHFVFIDQSVTGMFEKRWQVEL
jgi:CRISPR-associated endonuclease Csn1